ncbi:protein prenyltransferase alpha subunit repeat-containing protein 1-B [Scaptodrosophila lebanonensis]|uniref:Protein prenyltransferase alpha subunit repeat-containing protein 1-B n=1 Tax=Drosophila lebanonensis TaxID=7225 RepID=A0A6J2TWF0_DROLE|nr:protein prenyltransferase alpha subunit repeat-containing protein 1-B [Scaptodrosophila lebanonensis]
MPSTTEHLVSPKKQQASEQQPNMEALDINVDFNNEKNVLCEKIIRDINAVFLKDADLSSFEIIQKETNCNKSPVVHVEHNLGLESWCAQHVYDHAHRTLISHRRQSLQQQMRTLQQQQQSDALAKYLNVALLINPDVTTFWHIRRQLVQKNRLSINKELQFSALVLSIKPKSNEAFAYRRWLYSFQSADAIDWPNEISICERSADRCACNYHAWSHRQWVLQNAPCLLQSELMRTEKFIRKHISDYSSYHYRQVVLSRAYELCFYMPSSGQTDDQTQLDDLRELFAHYDLRWSELSDEEAMVQLLLPDLNRSSISAQRLRSFLYCCNIAAHDMRLCVEQRALYGPRDCFELHRRASLKFIVEQCVRLMTGLANGVYLPQASATQSLEFQSQLRKFDYASHPFLSAVRRVESELGDKHQRWCNLHLHFGYEERRV